LETDTLQAALEDSNPTGDPKNIGNTLDGLSVAGPAFPTVLVGPNAGGKSVALKMIETFHEFVDPLWGTIKEMVGDELPAIFLGEGEFDDCWIFSSPQEKKILSTLEQWSWLGPAWDLRLEFVEYSANPFYDHEHMPPDSLPPVVTVNGHLTAKMDFRVAGDCYQIRLRIGKQADGEEDAGGIMILIPLKEGNMIREEFGNWDKNSRYHLMEDKELGKIVDTRVGYSGVDNVEIICESAYRLLSGVEDNFLPVCEMLDEDLAVDGGSSRPGLEECTMPAPMINELLDAIQDSVEKVEDEDLEETYNDVLLTEKSKLMRKSWNKFFGNEIIQKYAGDGGAITSLSQLLDFDLLPKALRIDTLRSTPRSETLVTPTQHAVVEICTYLRRAWNRVESRLSQAKFYRFDVIGRPLDIQDQFRDYNPKSGVGEGPYIFPGLLGRKYEIENYPPFEPPEDLVTAIIDYTDPSPHWTWEAQEWDDRLKQAVGNLENTELSRLYSQVVKWKNEWKDNGGPDLKELADVYKTADRADLIEENHLFFNHQRGKENQGVFSSMREKATWEKEEGEEEKKENPEDFDDLLFSIIDHTSNSLRELYSICDKIRILSSRVSEYLGTTIEILVDPTIYNVLGADQDLDHSSQVDEIGEDMGIPYLSSGQAQFLTMLTQLELAPYEMRIALLDEPELSLHDKLISDLYEYLSDFSRENNVQVICSTHSTTLAGLGLMYSVFVEGKADLDE